MPQTQLVSPIDNSVYCERMLADPAEIEQVVSLGYSAQSVWSDLSVEQRIAFCRKALIYFNDHKDDVALEITWQMGRPIRYAAGEIDGMIDRAETMLRLAPSQLADHALPERAGVSRYISREPLGTILVVAPWNYPYLTAINTIIPALVAGNTVLLKHSTQTLLCAERFQKAFDYAGLPKGVFQYLHMDHPSTDSVIGDNRVNFVAFTGSVEGGKAVEKSASGLFKGVGLELGGKDPAYVMDDASLARAVEGIVDGAFFNSGQSCCGIERVYVHEHCYDQFLEQATQLVSQYTLGSPLEEATTLGPVVNGRSAQWVREQVRQAVAAGATACIPEGVFARDIGEGPYVAPQILTDVDHSMSLMVEESFGPVLGVMKVSSDAEALQLMNDSEFGLTASLWTSDCGRAEKIGRLLQTGTVFMNRCDYLDPELPWTGVKQSGRGCTLSHLGYDQLTRPKSFHLKN
ncbi:aldehyde dehydrogenase [Gammaproteobacteria bacterium 45_16_T64]|nr:aldehyde dehydrogenase [Gammaproteobacteria bacterium 45_16_T64]